MAACDVAHRFLRASAADSGKTKRPVRTGRLREAAATGAAAEAMWEKGGGAGRTTGAPVGSGDAQDARGRGAERRTALARRDLDPVAAGGEAPAQRRVGQPQAHRVRRGRAEQLRHARAADVAV